MTRCNILAGAFTTAVLVIGILYGLGYSYAVNDDRLGHYYVMHRNSFDPQLEQRYHALNDEVRQLLMVAGYNDIAFYRFNIRQTYDQNYILASSIYFQARKFLIGPAPTEDSLFPAFLAYAILVCFIASIAVAILLLAYLLLVHIECRVATAASVAISVMFALKLMPTGGAVQSEALFVDDGIALPLRVILLLLKPDLQMDFIGYLQKSQFLLLVVGIFCLRWSGRIGGSYLFGFVAGLFHQVMSWVLLAPLLLIDVLLRPRKLLEPASIMGVVLIAGYSALGGNRLGVMWQFVSPAIFIGMCAGTAVISGLILAWWWRLPLAHQLRVQLLSYGNVASDVILLSGLWVTLFIVSYVVLAASGKDDWLFWGVISGRMLAIIRPMFFIGASLYILDRFIFVNDFRKRFFGIVFGFLMVAVCGLQLSRTPSLQSALQRATEQTQAIERRLQSRAVGRFEIKDENELLYGMVKAIETGRRDTLDHFR